MITRKFFAIAVLASVATTGSALAGCPQIEGKYNYTCMVQKDEDAEFAAVLDVAGKMTVTQKGCELYAFENPITKENEEIRLFDQNDEDSKSSATIKKSTSMVVKFKTVDHGAKSDTGIVLPMAQVMKGTLRKKRDGFSLSAKETFRVLGIFSKKHSKFSCRFTLEN